MSIASYERMRSRIRSGDVVFIRSKGKALHTIISFFTNAPQIHVGIAFWMEVYGVKHLMIVEANGFTQRRIVNLSAYRDHDMDIICAPVEWESIVHLALDQIGKVKYGWNAAIYIGVSELCESLFKFRLPPMEFEISEICSKYVAELIGHEESNVSPARLYKALREQYDIRVRLR
jgi:hypothetical protein